MARGPQLEIERKLVWSKPAPEPYPIRKTPFANRLAGDALPLFVINVSFPRNGENGEWGPTEGWPAPETPLVASLEARAQSYIKAIYGISDPDLYELVVTVCDGCPTNAYQPMWSTKPRPWIPAEHGPTRLYNLLQEDSIFALFAVDWLSLGANIAGLREMLKHSNADIFYLPKDPGSRAGFRVINAQDIARAIDGLPEASETARSFLNHHLRWLSRSALRLAHDWYEGGSDCRAGMYRIPSPYRFGGELSDVSPMQVKVPCPGRPCTHGEAVPARQAAADYMVDHGNPDDPTRCDVCPEPHRLATTKLLYTHLRSIMEGIVSCPADRCGWEGCGQLTLRKHLLETRHHHGTSNASVFNWLIADLEEDEGEWEMDFHDPNMDE